MFKNCLYISFFICLTALSGCCGEQCTKKRSDQPTATSYKQGFLVGSVHVDNQIFQDLNVSGSFHGQHIIVNEDAIISGAIEADDIKIKGNLTVNGSSILQNASIAKKTVINGVLNASNSTFTDVQASTIEIVFKNSTVNSIIIRKPSQSEEHKIQTVVLNHTTILGNITFEKAGGKVIVDNGTVIKGSIIGGTIIQYEES